MSFKLGTMAVMTEYAKPTAITDPMSTDPMSANQHADPAVHEFYVSQVNWLVSRGREDLIDCVADEFERHLTERELAARNQADQQAAQHRAA